MGIYGQDWASYQPAQPGTAALSFAFIKVTQGLTYTNPEWQQQRDHARAAGLVVGYYHYPNMANSAQQEADHFLAVAQPQPGELLCLDWEGYDTANSKVSHAAQLAYKEALLRRLKAGAPHSPVGMYANTDYWRNVDTTGYFQDFLWIATSGLPAGQPGISAQWLFHQYTDSPIDSDYCHLGSAAELHSWALSFAQPTPEDDVTPDDLLNARLPALPDGYVPSVSDALHGAALADNLIAGLPAALLSTPMPAYAGIPDGHGGTYIPTVGECINGAKQAGTQLIALAQQVTGLSAAVTALATQLAAANPGVDTATVVAAVQAAIAAAVVHVDVTVTGPTSNPSS